MWGKNHVPRFSFIVGLVTRNAITTRDKQLQWGRITQANCPLCDGGLETSDHLFFQCSYSAQIAACGIGLNWFNHCFWDAALTAACSNNSSNTTAGRVRGIVWSLVIAHIWYERCRRCKGEPALTPAAVAQRIYKEISFLVCGKPELEADFGEVKLLRV
ncbi:unnamed protein product [Linum trigynum]|uniref:Reverse transcriptase zinc-binding domain-containing protein n=1 Tax=Linum trigynum TaxID=586398 RepID=A0AAV2DS18_9ROSI